MTRWTLVGTLVLGLIALVAGLAWLLHRRRGHTRGEALVRSAGYVLLWTHCLLVVTPFLWVILTSLKPSREILASPFSVPRVLREPTAASWRQTADNYATAWTKSHFRSYFANSVKISACTVVLTVGIAAMAAYVLARFEFFGRKLLYLLFLAGMMFPAQLILVPLFFQFSWMSDQLSAVTLAVTRALGIGPYRVQMHNSHLTLILLYTAVSLPFSVFVLTNFMRTIPSELREAALIDGATEWQAFWRVMLPMARPGLVSVAIFNFLGVWNEYLYALVFLDEEAMRTLPLGLASVSILADYKSDYGLMFAGLVITVLPILAAYLFLQRHLTRGVTLGALKG